jgi:hypothetical protein
MGFVGWVERSETHHGSDPQAQAHVGPPVMGFAALNPSFALP